MKSRYKIIISNRNLYKEIEVTPEMQSFRIGTGLDCDFRLRKDLFFGKIELFFSRKGGEWSVLCADSLYLTAGDVKKLITKKLVHGDMLELCYQGSDMPVFSLEFIIDFDNGSLRYDRAIDISSCTSLTIGGRGGEDIVLKGPYVAGDSISLSCAGDSLILKIGRTGYGIYHNGKKAADREEIKNGDFFSLSDYYFYYKDGVLRTDSRGDMDIPKISFRDMPDMNSYPRFNRNTRIKTVVNREKIEILDPPAKPQKPKNNIVTRLLPSMGMLLASGVMAFLGGTTMIIMSAISGGMAILTTVLSLMDQKKEFKKGSIERVEKYNAYIDKKRQEITQLREEEKQALETIYVSDAVERSRFEGFSPDLFDRRPEDEDFLCVRLGTGALESVRPVDYKKQERLETEDELQDRPRQVYEDFKYLPAAPIVCDLRASGAVGVVGELAHRFEIMKNMVIDLCARQYFSDLELVFVAEEENREKLHWLRMLPHVYNESLGARNIVCDDESKNLIFEYLYKELSFRSGSKSRHRHIVVFFFDEYGFKNHPISRFTDKAREMDVSFVFFGDKKSDIPMGCGNIISVADGENAELITAADSSRSLSFRYPHISDAEAQNIVELLAPVYTEELSLESSLTKSYSMFEMLNIIAVDDIDLQSRWAASRVYKSMAAPIGISKTGVVELDLHDKAHGPHGLVAGTTGSGKSEILQTYILAMSTLYHPYEVAFVIIDFKGGGMVNQFKELPHLLGAITNIDGKEINRSLKSIKAELQKRQRLFAEADVNHIDKYIRRYKAGEVSVPLPHLIIIVDEFAELKAEQPEFMKELISAARIGRSLGVHLILATQKPSGQVNEQIWSNSRFKLCLKVQSQEDSNEVLKSPLAAEIKEPGRAYLQVGNNEIFELFQSAYSGASEKADGSDTREFTIYSLNDSGKRLPVFVQKKATGEEGGATQLDAIVKYVGDYCNSISLPRLPDICLPPLGEYMPVPEALGRYALDAMPLGIYDNPDAQYQGYAYFNLMSENMMIIGSSMTGKTNFVQTIIRLAAAQYSPKEVAFYIADFSAMYLKNYENLNHVGGVVTMAEEEKLKNLFKLLMQEVSFRKARFLAHGLSSYSAYYDAGYRDIPHIFFIIENYSAFKEVYGDLYEEQFAFLSREGISCGITMIVTNATTSGLGFRYLSNFAGRVAFKCNDSSEYINVFDRCRMQPADNPGRMLCKLNNELFEAQTFIAFEGEKEFERSNAVKEFIGAVNAAYPDQHAKKIPDIPDVLTIDYIKKNYETEPGGYKYPIGLSYSTVEPVLLDLKSNIEFAIIGKDSAKKLSVTNSVLSVLNHHILEKPIKLYIVDSVERKLKPWAEKPHVERYTIDFSEAGSIIEALESELEDRYDMLIDGEYGKLEKLPHIIVLVNSKDALEYISSTKQILEIYNKIIKKYKSSGISFIFSDVEDAAVSFSGPEILKRLKENKKAIITGNPKEFKFCDLPSAAVRSIKSINPGDVFMLDGSELDRTKMIEEVEV